MILGHRIHNILRNIADYLWPRMGLIRFIKYIFIKLKRIPEKPHSIAAGFACGVFVSFTPFVGFHLILSAFLSFIFKGNIIASFFGTIVGNPWSFPIIWLATYRLGLFLMDSYRPEFEIQSISFIHLFQNFFGALIQLDFDKFKAEVMPVWLPMMIGSLPLGILACLGTYFPLKKMVRRYQKHRAVIRERKRLGLSKQKELKNKLQNLYKKIKRMVRKHNKLKWQKNLKRRTYIRRISKKLRLIDNKRRSVTLNTRKISKGRLSRSFNKSLQRNRRNKKGLNFSNERNIKKMRRLAK